MYWTRDIDWWPKKIVFQTIVHRDINVLKFDLLRWCVPIFNSIKPRRDEQKTKTFPWNYSREIWRCTITRSLNIKRKQTIPSANVAAGINQCTRNIQRDNLFFISAPTSRAHFLSRNSSLFSFPSAPRFNPRPRFLKRPRAVAQSV